MSFFYVYAPCNGQGSSYWIDPATCASGSHYCCTGACSGTTPCCCHNAVWGSNPQDIPNSPGGSLSFWCSPCSDLSGLPVLSIVTSTMTSMCSSDPGAPWHTGLIVSMRSGYNGAGAVRGTVLYGHVENITTGTYNLDASGYTDLRATTPANNCPNCTCYDGGHVHMECGSGCIGYNASQGCGDWWWNGYTWLFKYSC